MKNLILITIDSLRPDHLSFSGYRKHTSPNIDKLCKKSIVFTNAISTAPYTKASFKSIFTGLYPFSFGGYNSIKGLESLPIIFNENGFKTAGYPNIPILSAKYGYREGFDFFLDPILKENIIKHFLKKMRIFSIFVELFKHLPPIRLPLIKIKDFPYLKAEDVNKHVFRWLNNHYNEPFFLWIHYMDIHYPYNPPKELYYILNNDKISSTELERINQLLLKRIFYNNININKYDLEKLVALYDTEIRYLDDKIGDLINFLEGKNIFDETAIIITSDHGEEFLEHGAIGHTGNNFITHMYDELLKVPLILFIPGYKSKIINSPVSMIDLVPTILDLFNFEKPKILEGNPLQAIIDSRNNSIVTEFIISEASLYNKERGTIQIKPDEKRVVSLRIGKWKYTYYESSQINDELYDTKKDPYEQQNVIDENLDVAKILREYIVKRISKTRQIHIKEKIRQSIKDLKLN